MTWIDVHTHLDMLDLSVTEALEQAASLNVQQVITIGTEPKDHDFVFDTARVWYPKVYATLGVHPHQASEWNQEVYETIKRRATEPWIVALGEMGLDYYRNPHEPKIQRKTFEEQLSLAAELNLPVQVHSRDAEKDTLEILQSFKGKVTGIIHCFTGSREMAFKALDLGFLISLSGVVTFKNAKDLQEVVKSLPLDGITLETDSPFLTPVPHRGKKNQPAYVAYVAQGVGQLMGIPLTNLAKRVAENTKRIFSKIELVTPDC